MIQQDMDFNATFSPSEFGPGEHVEEEGNSRPIKAEQFVFKTEFAFAKAAWGKLIDFIEERKDQFQRVVDVVNLAEIASVPESAKIDRYAVVLSNIRIGENVLVSQRAYLENSTLGNGANAQENCFIINSNLEGYNITAHGAKIIEANVGQNVFVGFNSFLNGKRGNRLTIGKGCVIMPYHHRY